MHNTAKRFSSLADNARRDRPLEDLKAVTDGTSEFEHHDRQFNGLRVNKPD
jgi:hypothetical protein